MSMYRRSSALLLLFAASLTAQETRGRVQGDVRDTSGAAMAGASVTLTNDATGVRAANVTNETGHYLFDFVLPGHYTVAIEASGFRVFVQKNVLVETRGDITVNAAMVVGNTGRPSRWKRRRWPCSSIPRPCPTRWTPNWRTTCP